METLILSLDPGETTGWTVSLVEDGHAIVTYGQDRMTVGELWEFMVKISPEIIICEDFEYRPGKAKPNVVLYPVQLIGICNLYEYWNETRLFLQKASTGKSHYTDIQLKEHELYVEGLPHGRDSCRHFLQWLNFGWGYQLIEKTGVIYQYEEGLEWLNNSVNS
jgi:hypothetical protein